MNIFVLAVYNDNMQETKVFLTKRIYFKRRCSIMAEQQKKYSHVAGRKVEGGGAFIHVEGYVSARDGEFKEVEVTINGKKELRKVTNLSISCNNVNKTLGRLLDQEVPVNENGITYIDVALWGYEAERLAKVAKQGNVLGITGLVQVREYEGKKRLTLTADGFKVQYFKPRDKDASTPTTPEAPASSGTPSEDDLPF